MFSEWSDPYDIDHYYNDLNALMKDVKASPTSNVYIGGAPVQRPVRAATELKPEEPTGVVANVPPTDNQQPTDSTVKSNFEVTPGSSLDGYSLGRQPDYNILRSGPPQQESFRSRELSCIEQCDKYHFVLFLIIIFLACMIVRFQAQASSANLTIQTLRTLLTMTQHPRQ